VLRLARTNDALEKQLLVLNVRQPTAAAVLALRGAAPQSTPAIMSGEILCSLRLFDVHVCIVICRWLEYACLQVC